METHYVQAKIINKCQQVKHPEIYSTGLNYNVKTIIQTALYILAEQFQYQWLMMLKTQLTLHVQNSGKLEFNPC
jgi:hypothetical protein